jgi:hypothetical protein
LSEHARPAIDHAARPPASISLARVASLVRAERTIAFTAFVGLVLVLWVPFGPRSGLGYETAFPYMSERQSWWDGLFYAADPLRPYTSVFYQLSYLLGRVAGVTGSFVPYQIVYAALWLGRGVLTYEIVRRLLPRSGLLPFIAGTLVLVQASDGALNWVGQMNQFGMIFWLLLSVYFLVLAVTVESHRWAALWCVLSLVGVRLCLWSYESGLVIVLLAPAIVLIARRRSLTRIRIAYALLYYVPALYYTGLNVLRYANGDGSTYQESVVRSDVAAGQILSDLAFNVEASLRFWAWDDEPPATGSWPVLVGVIGAGIVIVGGLAIRRLQPPDTPGPGRRALVAVGAVGLVLLVASFPAYLLLTSARSLWRTQFLSGIGFGIAVAAAICLAASILSGRRSRAAAAVVLTSIVAYFGAVAAYGVASFHYGIWDRHRDAVADVLEIAPRVEPNSVIVYTGVPRAADPFGDTMWFDMALKLAYPGVEVTGEYFYGDGGVAPGANLAYQRGRWIETGRGLPPSVQGATLSNTVFVSYSRDRAQLLVKPPVRFRTAAAAGAYHPWRLIETPPPDERAIRRYGPIPTVQHRIGSVEP